jgi:hypothetical protein
MVEIVRDERCPFCQLLSPLLENAWWSGPRWIHAWPSCARAAGIECVASIHMDAIALFLELNELPVKIQGPGFFEHRFYFGESIPGPGFPRGLGRVRLLERGRIDYSILRSWLTYC